MRLIASMLCFFAALAGLLWQYPWTVEHGMFRFRKVETLLAYVLTATSMTFIAAGVRVLVRKIVPEARQLVAVAVGAIITFLALVILAFAFGPGGANVPGTRVRGIFFAEWSFVLFILLSIPFAVVAMVLLNLPLRFGKRAKASPGG